MTPKKPTLTKDRRAWLKSLKLGDKVIVIADPAKAAELALQSCEMDFERWYV